MIGLMTAVLVATATCCEVRPVAGEAASLLPKDRQFKLVWNDEFNGTALDASKWMYRTNFWGRKAHWFATHADNAVEVRNGELHMKLVKRPDGQFVSPQLQTGEIMWDIPADPNAKGFWPLPARKPPLFEHRYGYYECRFRLQKKGGWWSAFWMQTASNGVTLDPATSGVEHDIMESFFPGDIIAHCFHYNGYGPDHQKFLLPRCEDAFAKEVTASVGSEDFHVIGLFWEPDGYTIYLDGVPRGPKVGGEGNEAVSHVPEFILLTTECKWYRTKRMTGLPHEDLEGAWAAKDDFVVDYVRVFDEVSAARSDGTKSRRPASAKATGRPEEWERDQ